MARLTADNVREMLVEEFYPGDPTNPAFLRSLNMVRERLINNGKWKNGAEILTFNLEDDEDQIISLPHRYGSILGAEVNHRPRLIRARTFEFSTSGPGNLDGEDCLGDLVAAGSDHPTQIDIPRDEDGNAIPGVIRVETTNAADDGDVIRIYGLLASGATMVDTATGVPGEEVTYVGAGPAATTNEFTDITGVAKQVTRGRITLTHIATVGGAETVIAAYEPEEVNPLYQRYKVPISGAETVSLLVKLSYVAIQFWEEFVIPESINGLRLGLMALYYERQNDLDRANAYWGSALSALNDEVTANRGAAIKSVSINPNGVGISKVKSIH